MDTELKKLLKPSVKTFDEGDFEALIFMLSTNNYAQINAVTHASTPKLGYIAYKLGESLNINEIPIAAAFLRRMEGDEYAVLDGLVSNKTLSAEDRHIGITEVLTAIIQSAKDLNLKGIMAFSRDAGVLRRASTLGFQDLDQTVIVLPLT